jgi:hypothetical protein
VIELVVPVRRRLFFGIGLFLIFALPNTPTWMDLIQSTPVEMRLEDARVVERWKGRRNAKEARFTVKARYLIDGVAHVCNRAFLSTSMKTSEADADEQVRELSSASIHQGRAIRGGGANDCWLRTNWKGPFVIACIGFFIGFFFARPSRAEKYPR